MIRIALYVLTGIVLLLTLLALLLEPLVHAIAPRALAEVGLSINYETMKLRLLLGQVQVSHLQLTDIRSGKLIISAKQATAQVGIRGLATLDFSDAVLIGTHIDIFLPPPAAEATDAGKFNLQEITSYLRLIPGTVSLDDLRLYAAGDPSRELVELTSLSMTPTAIDHVYQLTALVRQLEIELELQGELALSEQSASYELDVRASTDQPMEIMDLLELDFELDGAVLIEAEVKGDLYRIGAITSRIALDHSPHYQLDGTGAVNWTIGENPSIDLQLNATLDDEDQLGRWIGLAIDLPDAVIASAGLEGSVDNLLIKDAVVTSGNQASLWLQLRGSARLNELVANNIGAAPGLTLAFSAPDLASLQPWTGPLAVEVGALEGSLNVSGSLQAIDLEIPRFKIGNLGTLTGTTTVIQSARGLEMTALEVSLLQGNVQVSHTAGRIRSLQPLAGVTLNTELNGFHTGEILKLLAADIPDTSPIGRLYGGFELEADTGVVRIHNLRLENRDSENMALSVAGEIDITPGAIDLDVLLISDIKDQVILEELTGLAMQPVRTELQITGSDQLAHVRGTTYVGSTQITSRLEIAVNETGISDIKGSITTPALLTSDFGLDKLLSEDQGESTNLAATEAEDTLSGSIPLEILPNFSFDTILVAARVTGPTTNITNLVAHVAHHGDQTQIKDFSMQLPAGLVRATASLERVGEEPLWQLDGQIREFRIERLLAGLGSDLELSGGINSLFSLGSTGDMVDEILADVDGEFAVALEEVRLKGAAYDQLATDTIAWFFTGGVLENETRFDCIMGNFKIADGIVSSDSLFAESQHLIADGHVEVNIPDYSLDLAITPRSKRRAFQVPGTIKVHGPMDNPKITTPPILTSVDTYAQVVLIPPAIALRAFDSTLNLLGRKPKEVEVEPSPCQSAQLGQKVTE